MKKRGGFNFPIDWLRCQDFSPSCDDVDEGDDDENENESLSSHTREREKKREKDDDDDAVEATNGSFLAKKLSHSSETRDERKDGTKNDEAVGVSHHGFALF